MDENAQARQLSSAGNATIRAGWESICTIDFLVVLAISLSVPALILLFDILHHLLYRALRLLGKMQEDNSKPFPFESLPQELRDIVYTNLLEDAFYPSPPATAPASSFDSILSGLWGAATNTRSNQPPKPSNWIFLTNKRIYTEYMDIFRKHSTFNLTVSPSNFQPSGENPQLWNMAPTTLSHIRHAHLSLMTTSSMLGAPDPRHMTTSSWALAAQIRSEISKMASCKRLTLESKAIGDPLWNPLWIWYHSSQSFKNIGTELSDVPCGPWLDKITFSLDTWSPGENHLQRDGENKGAWTWYCMEGHSVGLDGGCEQTVREFCGMLYRECRTCRPAEEGDEEEDE